ncbi:MAG: GDYXXLXY domain-containing protein [Zoogloeaceae bacterium]|jgi:uncharacterized membrane-anchored protein|nr:GDYXXLXY domain-containing protein [Zoogloeaceae bacterium]
MHEIERKALAVLIGALILVGVNYVIYRREHLLREGQAVFLELASVDWMQEDDNIMVLDFQVTHAIDRAHDSYDGTTRSGIVVLRLDERGVGHFERLGECAALQASEICMRYQRQPGDWRRESRLSTDAFFFQEGTGERYAAARYGEFRVAPNGVALLKTLRDANLQLLGDAPEAPEDDDAEDASE